MLATCVRKSVQVHSEKGALLDMMKPQEDKVCTPALSLLPLPWTDHHLSKYAASSVKEREMAPKVLKGPSTLNTLQVSEWERQSH